MLNFCTLFNSSYLSRGLTLYLSLEKHSPSFHLYILAFDDACYSTLKKLDLKHATILSLQEFETEELLQVKPERTLGEYCWTCTASIIWHCIHSFSLDHCTYLDADLMFFGNPQVLIDEMGSKSVLITDHHYTPEYDQADLSGKYCVQFIVFRNDKTGLEVLDWWRRACIDWCFNRVEDGKFGDQKYLDNWLTQFKGVHALEHLGGGAAPWNVQQYMFKKKRGALSLQEISSGKTFELIFHHYHDFKYCTEDTFRITGLSYLITKTTVKKIYKPYVRLLLEAEKLIKQTDRSQTYHEDPDNLWWIKKSVGRQLLFSLKGYYRNFYQKDFFKSFI